MWRLILRHLSPQAECDLHSPGSPMFVLPSHASPPSTLSTIITSPSLFHFFELCSSYFINETCVSFPLLDLSEQVKCHSCWVYAAPPPREVSGQSFVFLSLSLSLAAFEVSGLWELSAQCWCLLADGLRSRVRDQE